MDFEKDIIDYINGEFESFGIAYTFSGDINADLLKLFTIQAKYIFPFIRNTDISRELQEKINCGTALKYAPDIFRIKNLLAQGGDVNPQQSKGLFNYHIHDKLVYDWKIYHFHLSSVRLKDNYFTERTKEVLFVYIDKSKALLIDIAKHPPHKIFSDKTLLEILDRNWPGLMHEMKDVVGLSHNLGTEDRFKLRKYNINEAGMEINGKFLFPPGIGLVGSGHSVEEVMKLNTFMRWYKRNQKAITENKETSDKYFMTQFSLSENPEYKIHFTSKGPQIWDEKSQQCLIPYDKILQL